MTLNNTNLSEVKQGPILTSHVSSAEIARLARTTTQAKEGRVPGASLVFLKSLQVKRICLEITLPLSIDKISLFHTNTPPTNSSMINSSVSYKKKKKNAQKILIEGDI